ncbi:MAG: porin [Rhodospirillaceae bacterium]|nr:MAG: porin [Rhodospirillaceae bacterium]
MKKLYVATAALLASTAIASMPAFAADKPTDSTAKQIQMLKEQLRAMQQQLEALQSNNAAAQDAIAQETAAREASEKAAKDAALAAGGHLIFANGKTQVTPPVVPKVVESATHRFSLSSADGQYTIGLTGRVHFDMGDYIHYSPKNPTLGGINFSTSRLSNGVNARRARIGVTGKAAGDWTYTFIYDAGNSTDANTSPGGIQQAQIGYTGIKNTILEAGYSDTFFTLDEATSSNDIMFMERASPSNVATGFNGGDFRSNIGGRTWGDNYWIGAYLTGPSTTSADSHTLTGERFGAFERVTFQLVQEPLETIHIGAAVDELFKAPNTGPGTARTITLSDRPELRIDPTSFLSTGALGTVANPVTSGVVYNLETAASYEDFFYQGEYFHYTVNRLGKTAANFDGGYAEVSYTFGGHRNYVANAGAYSGVNPITPFSIKDGGMGAIELAARVSYVDLVDQIPTYTVAAFGPNSVNGGRQTNYDFGVNWYLNSNMRMMFNYIHSTFAKKNPSAAGAINIGDSLDAIAARLQFVF